MGLKDILRFISNLLKSVWLFFPSILFICLAYTCFISLGQGRDILLSFTENTRPGNSLADALVNLLVKFTFFTGIGFWAYVSWYSSRIVAYGKLYRQKAYADQFMPALPNDKFAMAYEIQQRFLDVFPRLMGYGCFIIMLFSIGNLVFAQSWMEKHPLICMLVCLLIVWRIDYRLRQFTLNEDSSRRLRRWFTWTGISFLVLLVLLQLTGLLNRVLFLFLMVLVLMAVYTLYINLRRKWVEEDLAKEQAAPSHSGLAWLMNILRVPLREKGYYLWFNIVGLMGLLSYIAAVVWFRVSVAYGPLPLVLLAFAILLGFGNIITAFSVKSGINLHFIIFLLASMMPMPENHNIRLARIQPRVGDASVLKKRQNIRQYLNAWLKEHKEIDSNNNYPVYFVLGNGGASRSAYWVASVLGRLQDQSLKNGKDRFSDHVFCLSGTSGGGVGVAAFYTLLRHADKNDRTPAYEQSARNFLRQDFLTYTLARMLGPDYFNYIPVLRWIIPNRDRADALESGFEQAIDSSHYKLRFDSTYFDECIAGPDYNGLPVLCINTTRVQDGTPGVVCSIRLDSGLFNKRVDVIDLLAADTTIRLSTAAILGARFPYVSPAGRLDQQTSRGTKNHYFVDGGYFDNSGAGVVQEMIRAVVQMGDQITDPVLRERMKKIRIVVLHITNSPQGSSSLHPVTVFKNDLSSPLLTILGAYDMQTTVNDTRLSTFIKDLDQRPDSLPMSKALYYPIHLYNDPTEIGDSIARGPYAMNWFISDSVRNQMDRRLNIQPKLKRMLESGAPQ